jgi:hypothetical protein
MIPKAKVKQIGLKRIPGKHIFVVAGYEGNLGYYPAHRKRLYKTYQRALEYSIQLRDYYQAPVIEY